MRSKPSCTRKARHKLLCGAKPPPPPPQKKKRIYIDIYIYNNNNNDDTNNNKSLNPMAKDELLVQRVDFELSSLGSSDATDKEILESGFWGPTYSVHCSSFFGLTNPILGILKGNPKKELQWRLWVLFRAMQSGATCLKLPAGSVDGFPPKGFLLNACNHVLLIST